MAKRSQTAIGGLKVDVYEPENGYRRANLLLQHGAWVGAWIWEDGFAAYLADAGYACYAPTLRGHYDSKPVDDLGSVSVTEYVQDVLTVAHAVEADALIGESAGGLFVQKAAESYGPQALVLMNSAPPFMVPASPKVIKAQLKYLPDLFLKRPNKPRLADYKQLILNNVSEPEASEFYKRICADSGLALREMSLGRIKVNAAKITCPVYVVIGHLDVILPTKVHRKIARLYGAEVAEYPTMSHHTFSEEGWEKVAAELVTWLNEKLS